MSAQLIPRTQNKRKVFGTQLSPIEWYQKHGKKKFLKKVAVNKVKKGPK